MTSTRNKTFETTWGKLESAFNIEESVSGMETRPKTTHSVRKFSPSSNKSPHKFYSVRDTSVSNSCGNRIKRPATAVSAYKGPPVVAGLTIGQIKEIYSAKCKDLGIPVINDQEKRFLNYCMKNFKNRNFQMKETGVGLFCGKVIGEVLKNSNSFATISMGKNLLKDVGATKLVKRIMKSLSIVHLDLSSNEITPEGSETILHMLCTHLSLTSLDISSHEGLHRNRLAAVGSAAVYKLLQTNSILYMLNIAGTGIGTEGLDYIINGLKSNNSLGVLNLSNNHLGGRVMDKFAEALSESNLFELNVSWNKIGNEGCEFLSLLLSGGYNGYCTLTKLDISGNEITEVGISKLFAAVRVNSQLQHLNLKKNNFSTGLSENFLQFLQENITVEWLNMSHCFINCEGLAGFMTGLSKNTGIKSLMLYNNLIRDIGAEFLARGLAKNAVLKHLDLSSNKIKTSGGLALARAVQANETLQVLLLGNNSLKDKAGQLFSEISRYKHNILKLGLELNPMDFKYLEVIKGNLRYNNDNLQKSMVPKLQQMIKKIQFKATALDEINSRIVKKQKEKAEVEGNLISKGSKLDETKGLEQAKLEELKKEYAGLKETSMKMSNEINELHTQITVRIKQRVKIQGEKQVDEIGGKIEEVNVELKESTNMSI